MLGKILDISTISNYEYITLMVNYRIAFVEKHWDCERCLRLRPDIVQRGGQALAKHKQEIESRRLGMGCEGGRKIVTLDKFEFHKCPGNLNNPAALVYLNMHRAFRDHGTLPYSGTMADQPAKIFDFFSVFSWLDGIENEKQNRRHKVKNKR